MKYQKKRIGRKCFTFENKPVHYIMLKKEGKKINARRRLEKCVALNCQLLECAETVHSLQNVVYRRQLIKKVFTVAELKL